MEKATPEQIIAWAGEYAAEMGKWPTGHALHHWLRRRRGNATRAQRIQAVLDEHARKGNVNGLAPAIEGPTPRTPAIDPNVVRDAVIAAQEAVERRAALRDRSSISFPGGKPIALAFISDIHFGSQGTDYVRAFADAEVVASTPGMYAVFHGDGIDNFIPGKLERARRSAPVTIDEEWELFKIWLEKISDKLVVAVSGNHDNWTRMLGGVDFLKGLLPAKVLYDPDELCVRVSLGDSASWCVLIRHKTRFNSVYNPLHGIKQTVRFHSVDPDIAVSGHVHKGAVYEVWYHQGIRRLAVLTGTYKREDEYARREGFVSGGGTGTAVVVILKPDGSMIPIDDIETGAEILQRLRADC